MHSAKSIILMLIAIIFAIVAIIALFVIAPIISAVITFLLITVGMYLLIQDPIEPKK